MQNSSVVPTQPTAIEKALDDPEVTDAQLGMLVRQFKDTLKAPQVVIVRSSAWEKALVLCVLALLGAMLFRFFYDESQREITRGKTDKATYILCDYYRETNPGSLPNECDSVLPG